MWRAWLVAGVTTVTAARTASFCCGSNRLRTATLISTWGYNVTAAAASPGVRSGSPSGGRSVPLPAVEWQTTRSRRSRSATSNPASP